jgi:CHAT domain-containing protein
MPSIVLSSWEVAVPRAGFRGLLASIFAALSLAASAASAASPLPPEAPWLTPGAAIERPLTGGESHPYRIEVAAGGRRLVTVEQLGIDVVIEGVGPDGLSLPGIDSPNGREGTESLLLPAPPGTYRLTVRSPARAVAPGRYRLRVEELPGDRPADRERLAAEERMTAAFQLYHQGTSAARRGALAELTDALARWRALGRQREEARTLFSMAAIEAAIAEPRPALPLFRAALALWTSLGDTAGEAASLNGLGLGQWLVGESREALATLGQAVALDQARGDRMAEATALANLCLVQHSLGDLAVALPCYERALGIFRDAGDSGREALVENGIGGIYDGLGEPAKALDSYGRALAVFTSAGDRQGQAQALNNLAVVHGELGEAGPALARYAAALALFRELGDRLREASALHNLGITYLGLGALERSRSYLEQALDLRRATGDRRGEAITLLSLGAVRARSGEGQAALDLDARALALARVVGDRGTEATALALLGEERLAQGDSKAALAELSQALERVRAVGDRRREAAVLHQMGRAQAGAGEPDRALASLGSALTLRRAVGDRAGEAATLTALARVEHRLGRSPEARRRAAAAVALVESLRSDVGSPELRAAFLATQREAFELEIDLLMELDRQEPGRGHAAAALVVGERARSRTLVELLQEAGADVRQGVDPDLRRRQRELAQRLGAKARRRVELASSSRGREPADAERELQGLLAAAEEVEAEIRAKSPRYASLTQPRPLDAAEIEALLDPGTLLLEYALGEERSFLWAVEPGSVTGYELPGRARIEAAARAAYGRLRTQQQGGPEADAAVAELGRLLLGPVADRLRDGERRLVIVPDGALEYIPFAALPEPGLPPDAGTAGLPPPLLVRHEVVSLPSASVLAVQRRELAARGAAPLAVAVLADPVFSREDARVAAAAARPGPAAAPRPAAPRGSEWDISDIAGLPGLARLPATRREAESIAALVPPGEALLALDFEASRETALAPGLASYRAVHFATHGVIDAREPRLSGLVLSLVGADGQPREGFLGLPDIYNLELGADLVVLSGCETALGREVRGEGLVGLTRGFFYAGARRVMASLWRVEDRATAELMARFYRALLTAGRSPAAALRQAQLAIRAERRWHEPYFWAPFVLQGDWR